MRHVDNAHHAEGDGQPDGRQQKDGTEADTENQVFRQPEQRQPVVDVIDRLLDDGTNFRVGLAAVQQAALQQGLDIWIGAVGQLRHRRAAYRRVGGLKLHRGNRDIDPRADIVLGLAFARLLERRKRVLGRAGDDVLDGLQAQIGIAAGQRQLAERAADLTAQLVVGHDLLEVATRFLTEGLTGHRIRGGIDAALPLGDHNRVFALEGVQAAVTERFEHGNGARITQAGELFDGSALGGKTARIERGDGFGKRGVVALRLDGNLGKEKECGCQEDETKNRPAASCADLETI